MKQRFLLKTMLLLCALVVGSSSVWATTYKSYTGGVEQKSTTISSSNVSAGSVGVISWTGTSCTYSSSRVNIAANGSITFTASSGYNITKIVIVSGSSSSYYGTWTSSPSVTPTSSSGTTTFDGLNANSVTVTTSTDFRCTSASSISIHYEAVAAGTTAAPSITGNSPFFGSTTATITNAASADGAKIYYTMGADPADPTTSSTEYSAPIAIDATTTVKAIAKKSTDTNASSVVSKTFTKVTPINVASALTAINALANNGTIADQAVRGIVTKVTSLYNGTAINYTISDDVAGSNELTVYRGRNMHNTDFSALSDLKLGDDVVIYGTLKKFVSGTNTTPEFDAGSYLLYQVSKTAPTFTLSTTAETLSMGTTEILMVPSPARVVTMTLQQSH